MKKLLIVLIVVALCLLMAGGWGFWNFQVPVQTDNVIVTIPSGASTSRIAAILSSEGVIRSEILFRLWTTHKELDRHFSMGEYRFDGEYTMQDVVRELQNKTWQRQQLKVTIPEGLTLDETIRHLSHAGLGDFDRYFNISHDPGFIDSLLASVSHPQAKTFRDRKPGTLEGFLCPDTYFFEVDADESTVLSRLVHQFFRILPEGPYKLEPWSTLILASIVEREAMRQSERGLIAGVFVNRLRLKRRLESCATVIYAHKQKGVNLTRLLHEHLDYQSPYNTYIYSGLPPGPICSPSAASLQAAAFPDSTDYLYFVADGTGGHRFAKTLKEHNRNIREVRQDHGNS